MIEELKPCPFCGGEASRIKARQKEDGTYYPAMCGCRKCGIWRYSKTMKQAIAKWNTRADDAPEQPVDNY